VGQPAPSFTLPDLDGRSVSLPDLLVGSKPVLLLFTNPNCGPCTALLTEAARWQDEQSTHFKLVLISQGSAKEKHGKIQGREFDTVLLQKEQEVSSQFRAYGTPSAVLVRPDDTIGSSVTGSGSHPFAGGRYRERVTG